MATGNTEQKTDNPTAKDTADTIEKKKSNAPLVIIGILVFLLAVIGGGFVGYTRLPTVMLRVGGMAPEQEQETSKKVEVKGLMPLEPFLVNLADEDGVRFLKTTLQLGMEKDIAGEVDKNSAMVASIRDSIIALLTSKTSEQIMTPPGKDTLREEIRTRINSLSLSNKVAEVYIVDFVVQL